MEKQKIIVVVGPTAAGKTALGIKLAEHFNGEVVSADSMQVYKNMPIASAAVTKEEMGDIPHHLVGILEPTEKFSVAEFIKLAEKAISDIAIKGKLPIIVGGTGLYIDSLINGIDLPILILGATPLECVEDLFTYHIIPFACTLTKINS